MDFKNKVVIITGASSGIGAAIALLFTKKGAKVVMVARNEDRLKNVRSNCEKFGHQPLVIVADVSKDSEAKRVINTTVSQYGRIDILVNSAGISKIAGIVDDNALKVFDEVMSVNLRSIVSLTHLATPHLIASKGNIVNVSSIPDFGALAARTFSYSTSKAALDHFSKCVAFELAPEGVRCNTVNPRPVRTEVIAHTGVSKEEEDAIWKEIEKVTALGRVSDASEVAELIVFLASNKARGITGSSFVTDNGSLLQGVSMSTSFEFK
ncbi:uncharacterized oxidoreductase MexAM1_META1p0182-like [Amyelois transitella]|uniref:uncharacterized oxidoreductase MexAM1_META1p0182-like n=1 Tax=Amyelois transitella TaxID=680683 RepID=UPI0029903480|nr:uncharacterized oxidoreductase MexAM1_META1p0182-like [Amyelois transitella]